MYRRHNQQSRRLIKHTFDKSGSFRVRFCNASEKRMISLPNTCLAVVYRASADAEFGADFGLSHTIHIAIKYGKLQRGGLQGFYKFVVFRVIRLFLFKAVDEIHWQRLIIREVKVYNSMVNDVLAGQALNSLDPFTKSVILDKVGAIINGASAAEIKEFLDYIDIFEKYRKFTKGE